MLFTMLNDLRFGVGLEDFIGARLINAIAWGSCLVELSWLCTLLAASIVG